MHEVLHRLMTFWNIYTESGSVLVSHLSCRCLQFILPRASRSCQAGIINYPNHCSLVYSNVVPCSRPWCACTSCWRSWQRSGSSASSPPPPISSSGNPQFNIMRSVYLQSKIYVKIINMILTYAITAKYVLNYFYFYFYKWVCFNLHISE